jgi:hypothetical protein
MRLLFLLAIVSLLMISTGRAQRDTPIGERIWKSEVTNENSTALMIAVTLRKGDDIARQIAPFRETTKAWWRNSDPKKKRHFLLSVIDEETRSDQAQKIIVNSIARDEALRRIFVDLEVASLVFGTEEGKTLAEHSLKLVGASRRMSSSAASFRRGPARA